jgi:hypothetical protein
MKTNVIVALLSVIVLSGCGPKEKPLSQADIQATAAFYGGNINFTATEISYMHNPAAPKKAGEGPTNTTEIAFSEGKRRETVIASPGSAMFATITRPDRNMGYSVWLGGLNIFVEQALRPPEMAEAPIPNPIKEKSDIGQETIDGHPCVKCKVIIQDGGGTTEWTTWEATDLNRFPIRAEYPAGGKTMKFEYTDVKLVKPDPSLFDPPKGCKKLKSKEEAFSYMMRNAK